MRAPSSSVDVAVGKLGMWVFLVTDAMTFGALLAAYGVLRAGVDVWPAASARLDVPVASLMTFVLLGSSLTVALAGDAAAAGRARATAGWLGATIALGLTFLGGQAWEYATLGRHGIGFALDRAASTFYVCTAWHGAHVAVGVVYLGLVAARRRLESVAAAALFWQFLDAVWILLFTFVYLV